MLAYLSSLWQSLPPSIRRSFYSLPLFVQWWPFLYFEKDKQSLEVIHAALAYFLLFMLGSFISFVLYSFAGFFSDLVVKYILHYLVFSLQLFWGSLYMGLSALLSYESYTAKRLRFREFRVRSAQKFVKGIEDLFRFA